MTTRKPPPPDDRPSPATEALKIATVLAGLMHLVLAVILLGIPGSTPVLDPLDTPDDDTPTHTTTTLPAAALTRDRTTATPPARTIPAALVTPSSTRSTPRQTSKPTPEKTPHPTHPTT
ncbi:hypothetical protein ACFP9Y_13850, partial [Nonomuraea cavernae]